ncbi:MAG: hypothetical protein EON94_16765, partial [Caulobacteraceae bacterium]
MGEGTAWREAIAAYERDEVGPAFALAENLGAGYGGASLSWYRVMEGEARAREASQIVEVAPGVRLEAVEPDGIVEPLRAALERVVELAGERPTVPILVTLMLPEADAPWHQARYGYMIPKEGLA